MKILLLSSFFLSKTTRFGGVKRIYLLVGELSRQHPVDVVCMDACSEAPAKYVPEFNYFQVMNCRRNRGIFKIIYNSNHYKICQDDINLLKKNILHNQYDVTLIAYSHAMNFFNVLPKKNLGKIIYLEDDLLVEHFRETYEQCPVYLKAWKFFRYYQFLFSQKRILKRCNTFISISKQEAQIVRRYYPEIKVEILKYGIPLNEYPLLPNNVAPIIGFLGNYGHPPNTAAIKYFLEEIFPIVCKKNDGYRLVIAGKDIPQTIIERYSTKLPVYFLENVKELKSFYQDISILINPVISGRGLRTKNVEAAAFGRPIITTPLGAEGLEDLELKIFTTAEEFIKNLNVVLDPKIYSQIVSYNRNVIMRKYIISEVAKQFITIAEQTC